MNHGIQQQFPQGGYRIFKNLVPLYFPADLETDMQAISYTPFAYFF